MVLSKKVIASSILAISLAITSSAANMEAATIFSKEEQINSTSMCISTNSLRGADGNLVTIFDGGIKSVNGYVNEDEYFSVPYSGTVGFLMLADHPVDAYCDTIDLSTGLSVQYTYIPKSTGWEYDTTGIGTGYSAYIFYIPLSAGDYKMNISIPDDTVEFYGMAGLMKVQNNTSNPGTGTEIIPSPTPTMPTTPTTPGNTIIAPIDSPFYISQTDAVITKGFSIKLGVSGGSKVIWKSKNKSIAAVNSSGKVTAKGIGKTDIIAESSDGRQVYCTVTVKNNEYKGKKLTNSDMIGTSVYINPYRMKYDKHGDLVITAEFVNNSSKQVKKLKNINFSAYNNKGKQLVVCNVKSKKISINPWQRKNVTFRIKKYKLKLKGKQDLRLAFIGGGTFLYLYKQ